MTESTVEKLHIHCFTKNLEISRFFSRLDHLIDLANCIGIPIDHLENYIFDKLDVLKRHDKDIQYTAKARNDMASLYKTTIPDLDEFQQLRPIHEKLIQAENENSKKIFK